MIEILQWAIMNMLGKKLKASEKKQKIYKKNQMEILNWKNIIVEIKNSVYDLNERMEATERKERIKEVESKRNYPV